MSKKGARHGRPKIRRSDADMHEGLQRSLTTLEALTAAYDAGSIDVAETMATVILNIVSIKLKSASTFRGGLAFPTPMREMDHRNMMAENRCISMRMKTTVTSCEVSYEPWFLCSHEQPRMLPFRVWWLSEPIFVEAIGSERFNERTQSMEWAPLAWDDRLKITREQFITDIRNCLGAHSDPELPGIVYELYQSSAFGAEPAVGMPDGSMGTIESGAISVRARPAAGMIRQIAEEVLMAYGRLPLAHWRGETFTPPSPPAS